MAARRPDLPASLVESARALLTRETGAGPAGDAFATRFGQVTAPLAAKAVEDTAFYREVGIPWLTEVGGDPGRTAVALDSIHRSLSPSRRGVAGHALPRSRPTTPSAAATCGPDSPAWPPTR